MQANRFARVCYEEAFKYAHRRRTFGKPLVEHPVIRAKLADMVRQIDATHAQMENITYQMCTMTKEAGGGVQSASSSSVRFIVDAIP